MPLVRESGRGRARRSAEGRDLDTAASARRAVADGFRALKLAPFDGFVRANFPNPAQAQPVPQEPIFPDLDGAALVGALRTAYTPPTSLGYDRARDVIFQWEQDYTGGLRCVYTGYTITLTPGADPSADAYAQGISTEHTWPQSRGAGAEPART